MNKFSLYFILFISSIALFSCHPNDSSVSIPPPRDYAVQYLADNDSIENYLKTHFLTKVVVNGLLDVVLDTIPKKNVNNLVSIWDNTEIPLKFKMIKNDARSSSLVGGRIADPVDYKLYYLILNEGGGQSPITVDSTYTSYKGWDLKDKVFDSSNSPFWATFPALSASQTSVISGFRQFLPLLKTAESVTIDSDTGVATYNNMGIGVVFIPSGLGYYNSTTSLIPAYSPLVFRIRLHTIHKRDHDGDRVFTRFEDLDNDGDFFNDDTDGDTVPNFLDIDDDGDQYITKNEIRINGAIPIDYNQIQDCSGNTTGTKKHLDKNCH
jgi:hypothetical protein